jgi:hypothetical protein
MALRGLKSKAKSELNRMVPSTVAPRLQPIARALAVFAAMHVTLCFSSVS